MVDLFDVTKMLRFACLCLIFAAVSADYFTAEFRNEFELFKRNHDKVYDSQIEEEFRMKIYLDNVRQIARHNENYKKGLVTFEEGVNQFTDMLHHEVKESISCITQGGSGDNGGSTFLAANGLVAPDELDWRTKGYVTSVKNQDMCGACYAFSAVGALEGQHFKKTGKLVDLSVQNLLDCTVFYGNYGCEGGWMNNSYKYIKEQGGIDSERSYPYISAKNNVSELCHFKKDFIAATVTGFVNIESGIEADLLKAVATIGPIAVTIDAVQPGFINYKSGIYFDTDCINYPDHAVVVIGYGTDPVGGDYWLVKNSWGVKWGDNGYIKMARNRNNFCGIASAATYPLV